MDQAKSSLLRSSLSISEIGYAPGFAYPQHFRNLFTARTCMSPRAYGGVGGG